MTLLEEYVQAKADWRKAITYADQAYEDLRKAKYDVEKADAEIARIRNLIEEGEQA